MLTANTQFENELKKLLAAERDRICNVMADGRSIKDYAEYRYHVGYLRALDNVVDNYCPETEKIINER